MFDQSPNLPGSIPAGSDGFAPGSAPHAERSRITAHSFRALTARLKKQPVPAYGIADGPVVWPDIPDIVPHPRPAAPVVPDIESVSGGIEAGPEIPDLGIAELSATPDLESFAEPVFADNESPVLLDAMPESDQPDVLTPVGGEEESLAPPPADSETQAAAPETVWDGAFQGWGSDSGPGLAIEIPAFKPLWLEEARATEPVSEPDVQPLPASDEPADPLPADSLVRGTFEAAFADELTIDSAYELDAAPSDAEAVADVPQEAAVDVAEVLVTDETDDVPPVTPETAPALADAVVPEFAASDESGDTIADLPVDQPVSIDSPVLDGLPEPVSADEAESVPLEASVSEGEPADPASEPDEDAAKALMKKIAAEIFARPSAADRAAFLRDVAAMVAAEDAAAGIEQDAPAALAAAEPAPAQSAAAAEDPLSERLANRIGPHQSLLRRQEIVADPFATPARVPLPRPAADTPGTEEAGAHALSLLDMMASTLGSAQPQERALAADTLLGLLPRVPPKQLLSVVERLAMMEAPPQLVVGKLLRDPRAEIIAPLLERCTAISDQELIGAAAEGDANKRRIIARRRQISPLLSDALIASADPSVLLTLIRNPGAQFSHDAFHILAGIAAGNSTLLAPLATRADLPAPVAFELFWFLPSELRRFVLSRFLTDSETLNKILKITRAADDSADARFPSREVLDRMIEAGGGGNFERAAEILSEAAGIHPDTATRVFADREGEPLVVALKAIGLQRSKFEEAAVTLQAARSGVLRPDRAMSELESIFDTLSFNKARILLTYWDWFMQKKGPYAPSH